MFKTYFEEARACLQKKGLQKKRLQKKGLGEVITRTTIMAIIGMMPGIIMAIIGITIGIMSIRIIMTVMGAAIIMTIKAAVATSRW
jgi:hypothetical protein